MIEKLAGRLRAHPHFVLIVVVFLSFRLLAPFAFNTAAPDIDAYMQWNTLADSRLYPYINYWSEYPPLFAWSMIGLYRLSALLPVEPGDQRFWFVIVLQIFLTLFDLGSLILVYRIALQLGNKARATRAAALFASGFIIARVASGFLDSVSLFFLLLAFYLALRDRFNWGAFAVSVGLMIKVIPIVMIAVALRRMTRLRQAASYLGLVIATSFILALPFLLIRSDYLLAFVRAIFNRPGWLSIWALLEGKFAYGAVLPVIDRFSIDTAALSTSDQLPWPIIHLAFLGLFLFIYARPIDWRNSTKSTAFAGLTVNLFLLWSKGFSGQFTAYAFPFIILLMPNLRGALYSGLLGLLWVAEWPLTFTLTDGQHWFITGLVIARTAILIALSLEYAAQLVTRRSPTLTARAAHHLSRIATVVLGSVWLSVIPIGVISINTYTQTRLSADTAAPAIDLIRTQSSSGKSSIVFASSRLFRRLSPLAQSAGDAMTLPAIQLVPEDARVMWLNELGAHGPFWFIIDEGESGLQDQNRKADAWVSNHACKVDMQWAGSAHVSRFVGSNSLPITVNTTATFADEVQLTGARLSDQILHANGTLCVELNWQTLKAPASDYTVFLHLVDAGGQIVAQTDLQPMGGFASTSQWKSGAKLADKHGLTLPPNLSAGEYFIRAGLYRSDDHSPVRVTKGENVMPDSIGIILTHLQVAP